MHDLKNCTNKEITAVRKRKQKREEKEFLMEKKPYIFLNHYFYQLKVKSNIHYLLGKFTLKSCPPLQPTMKSPVGIHEMDPGCIRSVVSLMDSNFSTSSPTRPAIEESGTSTAYLDILVAGLEPVSISSLFLVSASCWFMAGMAIFLRNELKFY